MMQNNYANIFTLITRMRQVADHGYLLTKKEDAESPNTLICGKLSYTFKDFFFLLSFLRC